MAGAPHADEGKGSRMAKKRSGRTRPKPKPSNTELAEPIPDTFDNVVKAVMSTPAKKDWRYLERQ